MNDYEKIMTPMGQEKAELQRQSLDDCKKPCSTPPKDPWLHRSDGMRCHTCMWFVAKNYRPVTVLETSDSRGPLGRCRRHCPTMNGFVPVFAMDWCGDHRLDETRA